MSDNEHTLYCKDGPGTRRTHSHANLRDLRARPARRCHFRGDGRGNRSTAAQQTARNVVKHMRAHPRQEEQINNKWVESCAWFKTALQDDAAARHSPLVLDEVTTCASIKRKPTGNANKTHARVYAGNDNDYDDGRSLQTHKLRDATRANCVPLPTLDVSIASRANAMRTPPHQPSPGAWVCLSLLQRATKDGLPRHRVPGYRKRHTMIIGQAAASE